MLHDEVDAFLDSCASLLGWTNEHLDRRRNEVLASIALTGTYHHTTEELVVGSRLAWRNHTRCPGQVYWRTLHVRDRRHVRTAAEIAAELDRHQHAAYNAGRIRPTLTVFSAETNIHIVSHQLVGYSDDPANSALVESLACLGWKAPDRRFERLPVLLRDGTGRVTLHDLDPRHCPDVPLHHPDLPWFDQLKLRWYAFPTISDMCLRIGGVHHPTVVFSGWYVATEIGTRDLGDAHRYNQLPRMAAHMGLDMSDLRTLWRDRAITELNTAVLASFERAGVRIIDHHTMADHFHRYAETRRRRGDPVRAEWAWIIPPTAASATPVFHQTYDPTVIWPNFHRGECRATAATIT
jgi:Nitric oxide synthase, oxygenase domain